MAYLGALTLRSVGAGACLKMGVLWVTREACTAQGGMAWHGAAH